MCSNILGPRLVIFALQALIIFGAVSCGILGRSMDIMKRLGQSRGIPGIDYPNYQTIPRTSFKCWEQKYIPGLYADTETKCQVFHSCFDHRQESFLCPTGTTFNQPILACDYWYSSDCSMAPLHYSINTKPGEVQEVDFGNPDHIRYDDPSDKKFKGEGSLMGHESQGIESKFLYENMANLLGPNNLEKLGDYDPEISSNSLLENTDKEQKVESPEEQYDSIQEEERILYHDPEMSKTSSALDFLEHSGLSSIESEETVSYTPELSNVKNDETKTLKDSLENAQLIGYPQTSSPNWDYYHHNFVDDSENEDKKESSVATEEYFQGLKSEDADFEIRNLQYQNSFPQDFIITADGGYVDYSDKSEFMKEKGEDDADIKDGLAHGIETESLFDISEEIAKVTSMEQIHGEGKNRAVDFYEDEEYYYYQDGEDLDNELLKRVSKQRIVYEDSVEEFNNIKLPPKRKRPKLYVLKEQASSSPLGLSDDINKLSYDTPLDINLVTSTSHDAASISNSMMSKDTKPNLDISIENQLFEERNLYGNSEIEDLLNGNTRDFKSTAANEMGHDNHIFRVNSESNALLEDNRQKYMESPHGYPQGDGTEGNSVSYTNQPNGESWSSDEAGKLAVEVARDNDYAFTDSEFEMTGAIAEIPHAGANTDSRKLLADSVKLQDNGLQSDQTVIHYPVTETLASHIEDYDSVGDEIDELNANAGDDYMKNRESEESDDQVYSEDGVVDMSDKVRDFYDAHENLQSEEGLYTFEEYPAEELNSMYSLRDIHGEHSLDIDSNQDDMLIEQDTSNYEYYATAGLEDGLHKGTVELEHYASEDFENDLPKDTSDSIDYGNYLYSEIDKNELVNNEFNDDFMDENDVNNLQENIPKGLSRQYILSDEIDPGELLDSNSDQNDSDLGEIFKDVNTDLDSQYTLSKELHDFHISNGIDDDSLLHNDALHFEMDSAKDYLEKDTKLNSEYDDFTIDQNFDNGEYSIENRDEPEQNLFNSMGTTYSDGIMDNEHMYTTNSYLDVTHSLGSTAESSKVLDQSEDNTRLIENIQFPQKFKSKHERQLTNHVPKDSLKLKWLRHSFEAIPKQQKNQFLSKNKALFTTASLPKHVQNTSPMIASKDSNIRDAQMMKSQGISGKPTGGSFLRLPRKLTNMKKAKLKFLKSLYL